MSARISRITFVFCVGVTLCSFASAGTFSSAVFTDTSGLDLTGGFPIAVDFNSTGDTTLGDATFIQDVGTFFGGTSPFNSGSTFPAGLQTIMDGGRFRNAGGVAANGTMTTSIPVTPGEYHRLQLLFHDPSKGAAGSAPFYRPMDITAEGDLLDNFSVLALQGAANTNGVVVTYDFLAGDASLDLTISTIGNGGADLNPFINAFSVENFVPEPATFGLAIFALVGLVAFSRRRHRAAVMGCLVAVALTVGLSAGIAMAGPVSTLDPDLVLWLDANQITGKIDNDRVDNWSDLSPVGTNDAVAKFPAVNSHPVYISGGAGGLPTVQFEGTSTDGTNDILATPNSFNSNPYTIFSVSRMLGAQNFRVVSSDSKNWLMGYWGGFQDRMFAEGWVLQGPTAAGVNPQLHSAIGNGIGTSFSRDGLLLANNNGGVNAPGALSLGGWGFGGSGTGTEHSQAQVSEVLIYDRVLTASERNEVGNYLGQKYGLSTTHIDPNKFESNVMGFEDFAQPVNAPNGDNSNNLLVVHPFAFQGASPGSPYGTVRAVNIANDTDSGSEPIDLLVLRPAGGDFYDIIHRVALPGDDSGAWVGDGLTKTFALDEALDIRVGDIFAHWGPQAQQPVPYRALSGEVSPGLSRFRLSVPTGEIEVGDTINFSLAGGFNAQARDYLINLTVAAVPEPSTLILALVGFVAVGTLSRRRSSRI